MSSYLSLAACLLLHHWPTYPRLLVYLFATSQPCPWLLVWFLVAGHLPRHWPPSSAQANPVFGTSHPSVLPWCYSKNVVSWCCVLMLTFGFVLLVLYFVDAWASSICFTLSFLVILRVANLYLRCRLTLIIFQPHVLKLDIRTKHALHTLPCVQRE